MMKTKHFFRGFFGVSAKLPFALAVLLMFAVSACDDGPNSGKTGNETGNDPKLPTGLQNTAWVHTDGDRVEFGTNKVTVIPVSGTEKTFTLKDSVTVSELSQTTLYFGDGKTSDFILCRDGTISSVFLGGVQKANGWRLTQKIIRYTVTFNANGGTVGSWSGNIESNVIVESGKTVSVWSWPTPAKTTGDTVFWGWYTKNGTTGGDWGSLFTTATIVTSDITVYAQWGGNQVEISKNVQLTEANWKAILTEIDGAGIDDVILDLSLCTRSSQSTGGGLCSDGTFDPLLSYNTTGKDRISSLILPNAATKIAYRSTFNYFSNLTSVSSPTVTDIGDEAFRYCTSLVSASFPAATNIGDSAFVGCIGLTSVSFSASAIIEFNPFYGCTSLVSIVLTGSSGDLTVIEGGKALVRNNSELIAYPSANGNVTVNNNITSIGEIAFVDCTGLTSVSFPAAASIGASAFSGCISLTSASFPAAASIGASAFSSSGTGTIPLTIILGPTAPTLGINIPSYQQTVTVKVPASATGYGEISKTYSGNDATVSWGNGFRGAGWTGTAYQNSYRIDSSVTLHVEYQ